VSQQSPPPPGWGAPPPPRRRLLPHEERPRQTASVGRIVLGVLVGMLLGFVEPFVLSFLDIVLSAQAAGLLLVTVPGTALVGGLRRRAAGRNGRRSPTHRQHQEGALRRGLGRGLLLTEFPVDALDSARSARIASANCGVSGRRPDVTSASQASSRAAASRRVHPRSFAAASGGPAAPSHLGAVQRFCRPLPP
jgi:hypothetical protein